MTTSSTTRCAYCDRGGQPLEPCCDRAGHAGRLVCQDSRDCMGVLLVQLHDSERREDEWLAAQQPDNGRVSVTEAAEVVAGRAVLADFRREAGECNGGRSRPADWEAWALRLGQHLQALLDATGQTS